MGNGFWLAVGQLCQMCFWTVRYLPRGDWKKLPRRTLMFGLIIPVFIVFQIIHWIGFAVDEVLFRKYRKVQVKKPVFVTGIPRSGTTHLQRVLANHNELSSMQMWECVFAPSISERYLYLFLGRVFQPVQTFFGKTTLPFLKKMKGIHTLGLTEAEEDFIALLPINACFLMVVLFPERSDYWRLANFDSSMPSNRKKLILNFYHRIIQKHLYFHGSEKRYLCKNPSFMTWVHSLNECYPDASFVLCEREAEKTIPSQLSSLMPTWELIYGEPMSEKFSGSIVKMLAGYYHYLDRLPIADVQAMRLPMSQLVHDLPHSITIVLSHCELEKTQQFTEKLEAEVSRAKAYKSSHQYQSSDRFDWSAFNSCFPEWAFEVHSGKGV